MVTGGIPTSTSLLFAYATGGTGTGRLSSRLGRVQASARRHSAGFGKELKVENNTPAGLRDNYLKDFDRAARSLPIERRAALRSSVVEHLDDALAESADARDMLSAIAGLGEPDALVREESQSSISPRRSGRARHIILVAVAVLAIIWAVLGLAAIVWALTDGPLWTLAAGIVLVVSGAVLTTLCLRGVGARRGSSKR